MSTSTTYSTAAGRGINHGPSSVTTTTVRAENGGYDWLYYIVYFLIALLVVFGILFVLIRTGVVGPNDWLYENTKWLPVIGENSWARQNATTTTGRANGNSGR